MARTTRQKRSQKNTNKRRIKRVRKSRKLIRGGAHYIKKLELSKLSELKNHSNSVVKNFFNNNLKDLYSITYTIPTTKEDGMKDFKNMIIDGIYYGQINVNHQRDGKGIMINNKDEAIYEGEWKEDKPVKDVMVPAQTLQEVIAPQNITIPAQVEVTEVPVAPVDVTPLKLTEFTDLNLIKTAISKNTGIFILILGTQNCNPCSVLKKNIKTFIDVYNEDDHNHNKNIEFGYIPNTHNILNKDSITLNKTPFEIAAFPTILKYIQTKKELENADQLISLKNNFTTDKFLNLFT